VTLDCQSGATVRTVTLTNAATCAFLNWQADVDCAAITVFPTVGALAPGASQSVDIAIDCAQIDCSVGDCTVWFSGFNCLDGLSAAVSVDVQPRTAAYCTAKVNSLGCTPSIGWSGTPSLSAPQDDFHIRATNVLNNKPGILVWGLVAFAVPFQGGTLCVKPPMQRTGVQYSGGNPPPSDCSGSYDFHLSQAYMQQFFFQAGAIIYAQYWSRDPGFAAPNNVGLTNALRVVTCP
jgi:hypothetical protein